MSTITIASGPTIDGRGLTADERVRINRARNKAMTVAWGLWERYYGTDEARREDSAVVEQFATGEAAREFLMILAERRRVR